MGSKGWCSGESTRLPPMWPRFKSRRRHHRWVELVVGSLLCCERFFSGYSGFLLSSKTSISKFQFDQESGRRRTTLWMCYLQIIIYLFIYLMRMMLVLIQLFHQHRKTFSDKQRVLPVGTQDCVSFQLIGTTQCTHMFVPPF